MRVEDLLDYELKDNSSYYGGVSYMGETVKDFLDETGLPYDITIDELNNALDECGIERI